MTIILQHGRGTVHFDLCNRQKRIPLLFFGADSAAIPYIPFRLLGDPTLKRKRERDETVFEKDRRTFSRTVRAGFCRDDTDGGERI
jgi:hypothetical protein